MGHYKLTGQKRGNIHSGWNLCITGENLERTRIIPIRYSLNDNLWRIRVKAHCPYRAHLVFWFVPLPLAPQGTLGEPEDRKRFTPGILNENWTVHSLRFFDHLHVDFICIDQIFWQTLLVLYRDWRALLEAHKPDFLENIHFKSGHRVLSILARVVISRMS